MGVKLKNIMTLTVVLTLLAAVFLWLGNPYKVKSPPAEMVPVKALRPIEQPINSIEDHGKTKVIKEPISAKVADRAVKSLDENMQPLDSSARLALGMKYYENNDLRNAMLQFNEAIRLDPGNDAAKRFLVKISREAGVEDGFASKIGSHFTVRYEGGENDVAGYVVAIILEEAYQKIGSDLNYRPEDPITVILYSSEQFTDVTLAPSWSGAVYDGKIRIPVGGVRERTDVLEKVIFHEYTHAVVQRMGGGRVPTWLNEGVAQYEEGNPGSKDGFLRYLASAKNLIPLNYLEGSFMGMNQQMALVAYAEGFSAVKYIIDEYGSEILIRLIVSYKDGRGSGDIIQEVFHMTYRDFQESWIRNLRKRYSAVRGTAILPA